MNLFVEFGTLIIASSFSTFIFLKVSCSTFRLPYCRPDETPNWQFVDLKVISGILSHIYDDMSALRCNISKEQSFGPLETH